MNSSDVCEFVGCKYDARASPPPAHPHPPAPESMILALESSIPAPGGGDAWGVGMRACHTYILRIHRHPTNSQKSYEFTEILRVYRNPKNSEESHEFTEILRVHRNPKSSERSYEFTEIQGIHNKIPGPGPKNKRNNYKILEKISPYKR